MDELFKYTPQKTELKNELFETALNVLKKMKAGNYPKFENLNKFGFSLSDFIYNILDYAGGPVEAKTRTTVMEVYTILQEFIEENSQPKLILNAIKVSKNHALTGYLIGEFRKGITGIFKKVNDDKLNEVESSFLDIQNIKLFFELGINPNSPKYKDDVDLVAGCANIIIPIFIKHINIRKRPNIKEIVLKDFSNIFNPKNTEILLSLGLLAREQFKKINVDCEMIAKKIKETEENENSLMDKDRLVLRQNELIMIKSSLERIEELYQELNLLNKNLTTI